MPRLIAALVRHAEYRQLPDTPSAHQPFPLTPAGRNQALEAGRAIKQHAAQQDWTIAQVVHSSRLLRAWETATVIAGELGGGQKVQEFESLAERSMGSAANLTLSQVEAAVAEDPRYDELPDDWKSNSHFCLPLQGAESLLEAGERVAAHLKHTMEELAADAVEDTLQLFVGHGAAIRHAAHLLGVLAFEDIARFSMYHAGPVYVEYSGKAWRHVGGEWKIRASKVELD